MIDGYDTIVVTQEALAQGKEIGLGMHALPRIQRMARRSAPFTHAAGNRRFSLYVLQVDSEQSVVSSIVKLTAEDIARHEQQRRSAKLSKKRRPAKQNLASPSSI